jgi:mannose-6-phosphate isomerase-like protein (cupin superfamily)
VLEFVDRNIVPADAAIGLHRHEANQEAYYIEKGQARIQMGIAAQKGQPYQQNRLWDKSKKQFQNVE